MRLIQCSSATILGPARAMMRTATIMVATALAARPRVLALAPPMLPWAWDPDLWGFNSARVAQPVEVTGGGGGPGEDERHGHDETDGYEGRFSLGAEPVGGRAAVGGARSGCSTGLGRPLGAGCPGRWSPRLPGSCSLRSYRHCIHWPEWDFFSGGWPSLGSPIRDYHPLAASGFGGGGSPARGMETRTLDLLGVVPRGGVEQLGRGLTGLEPGVRRVGVGPAGVGMDRFLPQGGSATELARAVIESLGYPDAHSVEGGFRDEPGPAGLPGGSIRVSP